MPHVSVYCNEKGICLFIGRKRKTDSLSRWLQYHTCDLCRGGIHSRPESGGPKALPYITMQWRYVGAGFTPARNLTQPNQDLAQKARSPLAAVSQRGSLLFYSLLLVSCLLVYYLLCSCFVIIPLFHHSIIPVFHYSIAPTLHYSETISPQTRGDGFSLVRLPHKRGDAAGRPRNGRGAAFTDTGHGTTGTDQTCRMTVSHDDPDT